MNKSISCSNVIAELYAGNPDALRFYYELFSPKLFCYAFRLLDDKSAAETIINDAFMKLWEKHNCFEISKNVRSFVFITVRNACMNYLKARNTRKKLLHLLSDVSPYLLEEPVAERMVKTEISCFMQSRIQDLPKGARLVCQLTFFEEMKAGEIAQLLHLSVNTVRNQKSRAIKLLHKAAYKEVL